MDTIPNAVEKLRNKLMQYLTVEKNSTVVNLIKNMGNADFIAVTIDTERQKMTKT